MLQFDIQEDEPLILKRWTPTDISIMNNSIKLNINPVTTESTVHYGNEFEN